MNMMLIDSEKNIRSILHILFMQAEKMKRKLLILLSDISGNIKRNSDKIPDIKLVLIGGGEVNIPDTIKNDVIDLGFVDIQDKYDACAGAICLCQPSKNESFSIVIMESWLTERPVLVHSQCNVTSDFARESNSGLYFDNYFEFEGCLNYYIDNPQTASQMGHSGRQFVLDNFKWDVVLKKFMNFLEL